MQTLEKEQRNQLERTIKQARKIAETAAQNALEALGVGEPKPFEHLNEEERELRRQLRAHGRQLGDIKHSDGRQDIRQLTEEVAYEHWHRMLFARFLAENKLLMYPDPEHPVPLTLEECEELAPDEGAENGWELAARYAAQMLPQIFSPDSPVFKLKLPAEHQHRLEKLLAELPAAIFTATDSLGWVYQFWQAKKKDEVNAAEVKIGARELPAVTQLFTEPYMVSFLLDNALGAWWAMKKLSETDLKTAQSEAELRQKIAIDGVPLSYLRFVQEDDEDGKQWTPAAGKFADWPSSLAKLKALDPCCGSGHFLVSALLMLVPMRMADENLTAQEAVDAVLRDNLHGLELDPRCVEIAAFALALTAWTYPNAGGYRKLPELHIACTGLSVGASKAEWKQLGLGKHNLTIALDWLHDTFEQAPLLGSLIDPKMSLMEKGYLKDGELEHALAQALSQENTNTSDSQHEIAVSAQGLAKATALLSQSYQWVITNVPYLARGKQSETLKQFCEAHYPAAKNDLATVFLERCLKLCQKGGTASIVLPQNWLFLTSYKKFREQLLKKDTWHLIARLGEHGFDSSAAAGAFVAMITLSRGNAKSNDGELFQNKTEKPEFIRGIDVSEPRTAQEKAQQLLTGEIKSVEQAKQLGNPDAVVLFNNDLSKEILLKKYADSFTGAHTLDINRFRFFFWETINFELWNYHMSTPSGKEFYTGFSFISQKRNAGSPMSILAEAMKEEGFLGGWLSGNKAWKKNGVGCSWMRDLPASLYTGCVYDNMVAAIIPKEKEILPALWCYCSSSEYNQAVRAINQKLQVANATLVKVPFDLEHWTKIAETKYPNGLPKPYTNDPTQWIFHGHPCGSVIWDDEKKWTAQGEYRTDSSVLHTAVARLLGYRWPAERDESMELADEQRHWVAQSQNLNVHADKDGIVCIPALRGEAPAADRLLKLLAAAYGDTWSHGVLNQLLKNADHEGKSLETWLRDKFFSQHCKIFQHRPFIWHIWDGLKDGFSALVNYHKLDYKLLETLIYSYLGDWITRQQQDSKNGIDGAEERLAAAETLKKSLERILNGESPYDIFVRWKSLAEQPIGWHPDLNDGVRLNIRPFMTAPDIRKKGAGVLRDKPNINWNKDRGKDVESAPWYHEFQGDRINDHHLSLAEKRAAKDKK
ncbi:restriction endonuclease subunit M [Gallibacterium anatis]|uniref:Eco57I restriction-modification methylase domain-containing protein n=1 Tax=Gallibacterium anatis TaxID=750 RepID=UPI000530D114|nr:N-6 DNA methylase [Gallibacterium anatis]KGQ42162.1 restriction endonuclease subunit M [Gallibacterium anatis]KGQ58282.1 restriction endonuclease subunit M [Gallibacterium anatis]